MFKFIFFEKILTLLRANKNCLLVAATGEFEALKRQNAKNMPEGPTVQLFNRSTAQLLIAEASSASTAAVAAIWPTESPLILLMVEF